MILRWVLYNSVQQTEMYLQAMIPDADSECFVEISSTVPVPTGHKETKVFPAKLPLSCVFVLPTRLD